MRKITIHFVPCEELATHLNGNIPPYVRGYAYFDEDNCYVCEDHYDLALIAHEIGHCLGKDHSLLPSIMNASGAFRWFLNPFKSLLLIYKHWSKRK